MKTQAIARFASLLSAALIAASSPALAQSDKQDYSAAERLLFMTNQMSSVKSPASIRYSFRKSGSLEDGFEDNVVLSTARQADGTCCVANTDFFTGSRKLPLPETPAPEGNPVILHFLERDIAEMKRLTKGSTNHFRKLIRMAAYQSATVSDTTFAYKGGVVKGQEVRFSPYLEDPNRPKYEQLSRKQYRFFLSPAVPGGVYGIRTQVDGEAAGSPPIVVEELLVDGGSSPSPSKSQ